MTAKGEAAKVPFEEMVDAKSEVIQANSEASIAQKARHREVKQVISELGEAKAWKEQFEQEIKQRKVDRTHSHAGESQTNIAAMGKAYVLTGQGKGSNRLQTTAVSAVRRPGFEMEEAAKARCRK